MLIRVQPGHNDGEPDTKDEIRVGLTVIEREQNQKFSVKQSMPRIQNRAEVQFFRAVLAHLKFSPGQHDEIKKHRQ